MRLVKYVSPEKAVELTVKDGAWVDYGFGAGFPELLDEALAGRRGMVKGVKIRGGLVLRRRIAVVEEDPLRESFSYYSWHLGDYERGLAKRGLVRFLPVMLRALPLLYAGHIRTDVAFVPVSEPDEQGYCSLGLSNYCWRSIIAQAEKVVFEIHKHYPYVPGVERSHLVHVSEADYVVEGRHELPAERSYKEAGEKDKLIALRVLEEIPDGAVLSLGVGGVPFAVASKIAESELKDIGCHTGTISDAFMKLHQAGKLNNLRKEIDKGLSAWNLAMGTQRFYSWLGEHAELFRPDSIDYIHNPYRIGEMKHVISINGAVQLDLLGQENGESAGIRQLSGIGGQMDFLEGAYRSPGGKGFVCLHAARETAEGKLVSNIVPFIGGGSVVSVPRTMIQYVATEYGVVKLSGLSVRERAEAMISVAHPQFRDELREGMLFHLS